VLVRSWNLFHGNSLPPGRRNFLEQAVRLVAADRPPIVCLQEVPAWALRHLGEWSGMRAYPVLAARPVVGPVPIPTELGRRLTSLNPGLLRSAFSGQGNAILVDPALAVSAHEQTTLNPGGFRRAQARWLGLDPIARLAWAKERRVCQAVRVELADGRRIVAANLHATSYWPDQRLPDAELLRAAVFADTLAGPDEIVVLAGDFNVEAKRSRTLADLTGPERGFSPGGPAIDHILVRGAETGDVQVWDAERRRIDGALVSDHAPIERELA
jgi:endonuclease/exonuclease/phosphatase family metal-dependent hydrolase